MKCLKCENEIEAEEEYSVLVKMNKGITDVEARPVCAYCYDAIHRLYKPERKITNDPT